MYLELTLNLAGDTDASAFYLYKPYIREDEGGSYVMKVGPDNRLYKQYLSLGKSIYSGEYVEVKGGLTQEDYIAFPYGNDVKEGVRAVVQGTEDPPLLTPPLTQGPAPLWMAQLQRRPPPKRKLWMKTAMYRSCFKGRANTI